MPACEHLVKLLEQSATADYIGEPVSQLEHALQCAHFARMDGADTTCVLAALLHDIGHFCYPKAPKMADLGVRYHEHVGAGFLKRLGFRRQLAELVSGHVAAKRYLVATNAAYGADLSAASLATLAWQGGPMNAEDMQAFERDPLFAEKLALRRWDEKGKVIGLEREPLAFYIDLLFRL